MADVNISKYRASVVRSGSTPATPGFVVSEGQNPVEPAGSEQNHLPVTINATANALAITTDQVLSGAGTVGQYIRGDGSLADFPASTGGGSSVSYYLNGSISQGTIGGVAYKELSKTPILGAGTQFTINADGYIASFLTDAGDPNLLEIPGGNWNFETYFSASSGGGSPTFYVELYKYDGSTFTLIASNSGSPELIAFGTNVNSYFSTLAVPTTALTLTDRLAIRYYVTHSGRTITLHTENNTLCQIITTFTTGLTALNGLTAQVQYFAVGTSGTDFNIASSVDTHTFNLPTASGSNRGALSSGDWTTFNNKQATISLTTTGSSGSSTFISNVLNVPTYTLSGLGGVPTSRTITINGTTQDLSVDRTYSVGTVTSVAALTLGTSGTDLSSSVANGTTTPVITLNVPTASASNRGVLSAADWTTFNNKQNALTNPVTGTGTTNYLPKFTGSTTIGNSQIFDNGTNVGIGTSSPVSRLSVGGNGYSGRAITAIANNADYAITFQQDSSSGAGLQIFTTATTWGSFPLNISDGTSTQLRITSGGNLLVGTTTDNGARLQVSGQGFFTHPDTPVRLNNSGGTFTQLDFLNNGTQKGAIWWNNSSNTLNLWTGVTTMTLTSGGNVLIGTTTDAGYKLDVNGTGRFSGITTFSSTGGSGLRVYGASGTNQWDMYLNGANLRFSDNTGTGSFVVDRPATFSSSVTAVNIIARRDSTTSGTDAQFISENRTGTSGQYAIYGSRLDNGSGAGFVPVAFGAIQTSGAGRTGDFIIAVSNTDNVNLSTHERMRITSGGDVLVGLTSGGRFSLRDAGGNDTHFGLGGTYDNYITAGSSGVTIFRNSTTERMRITSTGNVGIGTSSPTGLWSGDNRNLNILSPANFSSELVLSRTAGSVGAASISNFLSGTNSDFGIYTAAALNYVVYTNNAERMRITSGGNVLIGTTTDNSHKLRVNGTGYFDTGIKTGNPVGSTTNDWLLGRALVSGTSTPDRWIRVQIGNLYYDILAVYMGSV